MSETEMPVAPQNDLKPHEQSHPKFKTEILYYLLFGYYFIIWLYKMALKPMGRVIPKSETDATVAP